MSNKATEVRERVKDAYADAVSSERGFRGDQSACCSSLNITEQNTEASSSCCSGTESTGRARIEDSKGMAVQHAGYTDDTLTDVPDDAVENSFGCGNPLAFSQVQDGEVVLDLGSGAGIDLLIAAKKVGATGKVIGVDMTDEMLDKARTNIANAGLEDIVEVRKGIIEEMPVEDGSVDWVISNCVINLSPEKDRVFAEIARVLKPGGRMLVSDIVAENIPDEVRNLTSVYNSCLGGAISENAYLTGLKKAGLTDTEVRARTNYDHLHIEGILRSECCGSGSLPADLDVDAVSRELASKVWSANIFARKP